MKSGAGARFRRPSATVPRGLHDDLRDQQQHDRSGVPRDRRLRRRRRRTAWFTKLYSQTRAAARRSRRRSRTRARATYAGKVGPDPLQYSCQQNFTMLTTDGYWNSGTTNGTAAERHTRSATRTTTSRPRRARCTTADLAAPVEHARRRGGVLLQDRPARPGARRLQHRRGRRRRRARTTCRCRDSTTRRPAHDDCSPWAWA